jgi:hypothetical protein
MKDPDLDPDPEPYKIMTDWEVQKVKLTGS